MGISLLKQREWIDFIYDRGRTDVLLGGNFRAEYIEDKQTLQVTIDCSHNLKGRDRTNNQIDAETFIDNYYNKLKSIMVRHDYISKYLKSYGSNKNIKQCELVLTFLREYKYPVKIIKTEDNGTRFDVLPIL